MFRPLTGSSSGLYNNLESVVHVSFTRQTGSRVVYSVVHPVWHVKPKHVLHFLSYCIGLMMTQ
jgi:hypothetical protein